MQQPKLAAKRKKKQTNIEIIVNDRAIVRGPQWPWSVAIIIDSHSGLRSMEGIFFLCMQAVRATCRLCLLLGEVQSR